MQIVFSFNDQCELSGKTIVAATCEQEQQLKTIARKMLIAAMQPGHVCQCGGQCKGAVDAAA